MCRTQQIVDERKMLHSVHNLLHKIEELLFDIKAAMQYRHDQQGMESERWLGDGK